MSIARSVRVEYDKLVVGDDDGAEWSYAQGKKAPDGAAIHINCKWGPVGGPPELELGSDGKPLLRQAGKGLPKTAIVYLVGGLSAAMGQQPLAAWPGTGLYEFNQVP